jgi:beta-glucanase (GH16 family)
MELIWQDEFDYEGPPDPQKWEAQVGGHGWGNNETQYYTESGNAWVENGKLIIEARREARGGKEVTSARLRTQHKGDWLYGRVEVRAKLPKGLGCWPAAWMLPTIPKGERLNWPECGEIDIMEYVAYMPNTVHATIHTLAYNHEIETQRGASMEIKNAGDGFHVYSVDWAEKEMVFEVDGETIFTYNPWEDGGDVTDAEWPFDKPFHLVLNLAFGGDWGGANGVDLDALPARYEIDYVRVYSLKKSGV